MPGFHFLAAVLVFLAGAAFSDLAALAALAAVAFGAGFLAEVAAASFLVTGFFSLLILNEPEAPLALYRTDEKK